MGSVVTGYTSTCKTSKVVITDICIEEADVLGISVTKAVPHAGHDASF